MEVLLSRILPDDTLSRFRVRDMRPDEIIRAHCANAAEFGTAKRQAAEGAKSERVDGFKYKVVTNSIENTVTISLYNPDKLV